MTLSAPARPNPFSRILAAVGRRTFGTLTRVQTDAAVAALTFDDGPHPEFTPRLLEVLRRHGAHATFFVLGKQAAAHPDLIAQIAAEGHAVGNHTYDHVKMPQTPRRERIRQLLRSRRAIGPQGSSLFRPPYGGQTFGSRVDAALLGYDVVTWNMHAEDWAGHDSATMRDRLVRQLRPGSIILLHDMLHNPRVAAAADRGPTITAIDEFLSLMGEQYHFLTIPALMQAGRPVRTNWYRPAL